MTNAPENDGFDQRLAELEAQLASAQSTYEGQVRTSEGSVPRATPTQRAEAKARLPGLLQRIQGLRQEIDSTKREAYETRSLRRAELAEAKRDSEVAEGERRRDEEVRASLEHAARKDAADDANFWLRRLMLQPQLGNGAAFLALAGGVLQADNIAAAAELAKEPFSWFATGLAVSGIPPFFLWGSRLEPKRVKIFERLALYFTLLSGAFFFVGLWDGVMVMRHAKQALAEQAKAGSPPIEPNAPVAKSPPPSPPRETSAPQPHRPGPQVRAAQPPADQKVILDDGHAGLR